MKAFLVQLAISCKSLFSELSVHVRIQKKMLGQVFTLTFELKNRGLFFFFFDKKLIGFG